jgi:hypothetical protein
MIASCNSLSLPPPPKSTIRSSGPARTRACRTLIPPRGSVSLPGSSVTTPAPFRSGGRAAIRRKVQMRYRLTRSIVLRVLACLRAASPPNAPNPLPHRPHFSFNLCCYMFVMPTETDRLTRPLRQPEAASVSRGVARRDGSSGGREGRDWFAQSTRVKPSRGAYSHRRSLRLITHNLISSFPRGTHR